MNGASNQIDYYKNFQAVFNYIINIVQKQYLQKYS